LRFNQLDSAITQAGVVIFRSGVHPIDIALEPRARNRLGVEITWIDMDGEVQTWAESPGFDEKISDFSS